jgi:rRNA biogenesis protein RRP5
MRNPQLSLKTSVVQGDYTEPIEFGDLQAGQIVTARVRHVQDFGVFLVVDNSNNVSGLCHISQLADTAVDKDKVTEMYKKGDVVKAKITKIEPKKRKISFTLKYSQIKGDGEDEDMEDASEAELAEDDEFDGGIELDNIDMRSVKSAESDEDGELADADEAEADSGDEAPKATTQGLSTSGFDWTGATLDFDEQKGAAESDDEDDAPKKKKKSKKATIKEDRTGDLDAYGPQSVADFERLLLGQPNSAEMWVRYIVFQRELNEIEKARQIAKRALATINPREEKEKLDVWTALLHLENDFASDDEMDKVFKEACQNNDSREMHERMIKIYISSAKLDVSTHSNHDARCSLLIF